MAGAEAATPLVHAADSPVEAPEPPREQAHKRLSELEEWLISRATLESPLHEVEAEQEERMREVARLLFQYHLDQRGTGDVGPALEVVDTEHAEYGEEEACEDEDTVDDDEIDEDEDEDEEAADEDEEAAEVEEIQRQGQKRLHKKQLLTIFGLIVARRTAYYAPGATSVHPLDEEAWLPPRKYSYTLQRRLLLGVLQGPFDEALERLEEWTGVRVPKRIAEQLVCDAAVDFDAFYAERKPPPAEETGPIVVGSVDGKGVPMIKPEEALRVVRRGKGEKANKKRMATVATAYTQQPKVRTAEEVVESLFYEGPRLRRDSPKPRNVAEHKRVWASLKQPKDDVIAAVADEIDARDPEQEKKLALVVDGERALQQRLVKAAPHGTEILDLLHVLEKLWKAAYCFYDEGSEEAKEWVRSRTLRILRGEVSQVIKGMRQSATKLGLSKTERQAVDNAASYFYKNRHRMRYDEYLRQGLPIASGAIEGACKNLVKSRMERSGMRWTLDTGEAMLRLRAAYLSGDFEEYWRFHVHQEQHRLHPPDRWRVVTE